MVREFFDAAASTWDDDPAHRARNEQIAAGIRERLDLRPTARAIDVGAGTGMLSVLLADAVGQVLVTDPSPGMIEVAARRIIEAGLSDRMTALELDLTGPDIEHWLGEHHGSFDLVWSAMAFHHVLALDELIAHINELLAPGGQVAVADLDRDPGGHFHEHHPDFHGHDGFDREALAGQLVAAGFEDVVFSTVTTVAKEGRDYPVFLLTARKPS